MNMTARLPAEIELEPMASEEEVRRFMRATVEQYSHDLTHSLLLGREEAESKAQRDLGQLLKGGPEGDCHRLVHGRMKGSGEIAGSAWVVLEPEIRTAWIYYILIYKPFRGRGLGRALLARLHDLAREMGCDQVSLYVYEHNKIAQALYRKAGYRESAHFMRASL